MAKSHYLLIAALLGLWLLIALAFAQKGTDETSGAQQTAKSSIAELCRSR